MYLFYIPSYFQISLSGLEMSLCPWNFSRSSGNPLVIGDIQANTSRLLADTQRIYSGHCYIHCKYIVHNVWHTLCVQYIYTVCTHCTVYTHCVRHRVCVNRNRWRELDSIACGESNWTIQYGILYSVYCAIAFNIPYQNIKFHTIVI